MEEMLHSVLDNMSESSLQEALFEILVLGTVLQTIESILDSSFQKSVKNLTDGS